MSLYDIFYKDLTTPDKIHVWGSAVVAAIFLSIAGYYRLNYGYVNDSYVATFCLYIGVLVLLNFLSLIVLILDKRRFMATVERWAQSLNKN